MYQIKNLAFRQNTYYWGKSTTLIQEKISINFPDWYKKYFMLMDQI